MAAPGRQEDELIADWSFSENELILSDTILGRGAFGEVRIAKWRNVDIAAKRLHHLSSSNNNGSDSKGEISESDKQTIYDSFKAEMKTLSRLRHPNLVLFLGVAYNSKQQPTTILTELMPCSLYDILETKKIRLTLPEILDVSLDVISGLVYLHNHHPQIIHRDISSKNILIGGNKAKLADLGQAKIFDSSTLSRQTSMPGAMAYSAPEVLTGKYSSKIDIFSFGVLLVQMCCYEYPRIDRREDQLKKACMNHIPLVDILLGTMNYQPADRPSADSVHATLLSIITNDRFYPPTRRLLPYNEIGILANKVIENTIEEKCKDTKIILEHTTRRLEAETHRWRDEATRNETLEKTITSLKSDCAVNQETINRLKREIDVIKQKNTTLEKELDESRNENQNLTINLNNSTKRSEESSITIEKLKQDNLHLAKRLKENEDRVESLENIRSQLEGDLSNAKETEIELKHHLEMQVDHSRELDIRLEQALVRWKQEKELASKEAERFGRLRQNCAELADKNNRLTEEVDRLVKRLQLYDSLPMPDEIKTRLKDLDNDLRKMQSKNIELLEKYENAESELNNRNEKIEKLTCEMEELKTVEKKQKEDLEGNVELLKSKDDTILSLQEELETCKSKISEMASRIYSENIEGNTEDGILKPSSMLLHSISEDEDCENQEYNVDEFDNDETKSNDANPSGKSRALQDADAMKRMTIRSRLNYVKSSSTDDTETAGFRDRSVTRFHKFAGSNIADLITAAHKTKESLASLNKIQEEGKKLDPLEQRRERDAVVKMQIFAVQKQGVNGILKYMKENIDCEFACWRSARALREVIMKNKEESDMCQQLNAEETLLLAMHDFVEVSVVQAQCLRAIATMCFGNETMKRHCGEKDAIARILQGMAAHISDESVQQYGCTALTNLCHNSRDNRSRFTECAGSKVIIDCLDFWASKSPNILKQACWAVLTLAATDEIARTLSTEGVGSKIVDGMIRHSSDHGVQQFGCWALGNLILAGDEVKRKMKKIGVMEVCRIALENHSKNVDVVRQAQHTLSLITSSSNNVDSPTRTQSKRNDVQFPHI